MEVGIQNCHFKHDNVPDELQSFLSQITSQEQLSTQQQTNLICWHQSHLLL